MRCLLKSPVQWICFILTAIVGVPGTATGGETDSVFQPVIAARRAARVITRAAGRYNG